MHILFFVTGEWLEGSFSCCQKVALCFTNCASVFLFLCFRSKDSVGWELIFSTPYLHNTVERMALNAKVSSSSFGDKMLAVSSGWFIKTF